jgi:hypothetical protein
MSEILLVHACTYKCIHIYIDNIHLFILLKENLELCDGISV